MQATINEIAELNQKIGIWLRSQVKAGIIVSLKIESKKEDLKDLEGLE